MLIQCPVGNIAIQKGSKFGQIVLLKNALFLEHFVEKEIPWVHIDLAAGDNEGGLAYYQSRGFENYGRIENYVLSDGTVVDKVLKRLDIT